MTVVSFYSITYAAKSSGTSDFYALWNLVVGLGIWQKCMTEKCFQRFIIYYLDAEAQLSGRNRASDALQLLWDHTELLPERIHKAHSWLPEIKEQAELIWSLPLLADDVLENFSDSSSLWTTSQQYNPLWFHHSDVCASVVQTMETGNAPFSVCPSRTFWLYVLSAKVSPQDKINDTDLTLTKIPPLPNTQCH